MRALFVSQSFYVLAKDAFKETMCCVHTSQEFIERQYYFKNYSHEMLLRQRGIENPFKHLGWSVLQK